MQKLVIGIIAVICLHIGFVAYISLESDADRAVIIADADRVARVAVPVAPRTGDDEIVIARGDLPAIALNEFADLTAVPAGSDETTGPVRARGRDPRRSPSSRNVPPATADAERTTPIYQNASYTVVRTEFSERDIPAVTSDVDDNVRSGDTRTAVRSEKRSLLSKVGSIVKKPYDGLKAVASFFD